MKPEARGPRVGARDRLQPALLDRLVDDRPDQHSEAPGAGSIDHAQLRAAVLRDLRWLLNTINAQGSIALEHVPHARASTVNFGIAPLAGLRMSEIDWTDIEDAIRQAIIDFEPRILPASVEVLCATHADHLAHYNVLSLDIRGLLWCVPHAQAFLFRTDIDLESGHMDLRDIGA